MVSGSGSDVAHRCTDSIFSHSIRYPHTDDRYRVGVYQMSCSGVGVGRSRLPVPLFPLVSVWADFVTGVRHRDRARLHEISPRLPCVSAHTKAVKQADKLLLVGGTKNLFFHRVSPSVHIRKSTMPL